jgi:ribonuclease HI
MNKKSEIVKKDIDQVVVYTDGSCVRKLNDKNETILMCGYGIYFPNKELPNVSRPFINNPPTNNRAELQAIYVALIQIKKQYNYKKIYIYTDSQYCISSLTKDVLNWEKNGWINAKKQPVKNQDIIKPLHNIIKKQRDKIVFVHVKAHTNKQDEFSVNNSIVDKLAKKGGERAIPYKN